MDSRRIITMKGKKFMTFSEYLKSLKEENTPEGDLARDFIKSKCKAKTYLGVFNHLLKNNAEDAAFEALEKVKRRYEKEMNI